MNRFQCANAKCNFVFDSTDEEGELTECSACGLHQKAIKAFDGVTPRLSDSAGVKGIESRGDGNKIL